jgi:hypothetical protein
MMKKNTLTLLFTFALASLAWPFGVVHSGTSGTPNSQPHAHPAKAASEAKGEKATSLVFEIKNPLPLKAGETQKLTLRLTSRVTGKPLTFADLKEVHTQKLHLLVIDPTLTDYQHLHPVEGQNAGEFVVDFTPRKDGMYRLWADVVPVATGQQEYILADLGAVDPAAKPVSVLSNTTTVDGYTFTLTFDTPPKAKAAAMGTLTVTKEGIPFAQLEPVMGAFAHVVGFPVDFQSVVHIHPMGKEPENANERGGATLMFHIEPEKAGFIKMFAQVRIKGKDIFAPFGINVGE